MKRRILIIDDDPVVREAISRVLEGVGYDVVESADGNETTARSVLEEIDLVLLDLNLPRRSGWEVYERLRTQVPLIPVVIITGIPNQNQTALAAGASALMEKPIDVSALLQTVDELLVKAERAHHHGGSGYYAAKRHRRRPKSKTGSTVGGGVPTPSLVGWAVRWRRAYGKT